MPEFSSAVITPGNLKSDIVCTQAGPVTLPIAQYLIMPHILVSYLVLKRLPIIWKE